MRRNGLFIFAFLLALLFWQWAYFTIDRHYSGLAEAQQKIALLNSEVERSMVRAEVVQWKFDLFRQQVAKSLPTMLETLEPSNRGEGRSIASVAQAPPEEFLLLAQFETSIEDLRVLFEKRQYKEVIRKAKNIINMSPVSPSLVSVYFMLAESYYQDHDFEACFSTAQQMIQLFPEQEKTGYVMLRVGMFLKEKNRFEEAKNMFSLVAHAFAEQKELKAQSEKLLANMGSME